MTDRQLVDWIIERHERGFSDDADDRGGATFNGITLRLFSSFMGREMTVDQLKALPRKMQVDILHSEFCFKPKLHLLIDARVKLCAMDFAIHSSPIRAVRSLQYGAGLDDELTDGVLGPKTLEAVNGADPATVHRRMLAYRMRFIAEAIRAHPTNLKFRGWWNRLANLVELPPSIA